MQLELPVAAPLSADLYDFGVRSSGQTHGVVLTKPHIVDLVLDLAGYTEDRDLATLRLLEPSCGTGAFLIRALERLLTSAQRHGHAAADLAPCLLGVDIDAAHCTATREALATVLHVQGAVDADTARGLVAGWVRQADFLLEPLPTADIVVGNPPYVRVEQIAPALQAEYRRRFESLFDRADLYVAFIERALHLLAPGGILSFICADRWISNRYGAPLRQLVTDRFRLFAYVDLHQASPFEAEVIAYPSIFGIGTGRTERVLMGRLETATAEECQELRRYLRGEASRADVASYDTWFSGAAPWVTSGPEHLRLLRRLEAQFETLEADGVTRVGIGVATGADAAYIVDATTGVEADRLVPLVRREDLRAGRIENAGRFVLNTFGDDGRVVDLGAFPGLAAHLDQFPTVRARHVAKKNPTGWFRTIDRVYPELVGRPKLLIPDIAGSNEVTFDAGQFHPHHNLYFVTSDAWDLEVLGGLLSSKVALFFVWSYAVKMRGGYLRFQAQYLRRIRVPSPRSLRAELSTALRDAFRARDFAALDALALEAYGLDALIPFDFVDTRG